MPRKPAKGYFVRGHFVAEGSPLDEQFKRERQGQGPSKTALKAQSAELQALGEQLLVLRADLRAPLALPERLLEALAELARIKDFEGRRRQSQFVGKMMLQLDAEQIAAIRAALDAQLRGSAAETLLLHEAEAWRERLLADDAAQAAWAAEFPHTDAPRLRALVQQARQSAPKAQAQAQRNHRAYRELFQWLRAQLAQGNALD